MTVHLDTVSDEVLMERIRAHDSRAFAVLVHRHSAKFYAVAYRTLLNKSEAEDMVQEAFIKLWQNPSSWRADKQTRFTTWFYRVIVHACIDAGRRARPVSLPDDYDAVDTRENVLEYMEQAEQTHALARALKTLTHPQRMALHLCVHEAMPQKQAAQMMGVSVKALESLLMRAKEQLKHTIHTQSEVRHAG